MRTCQHCSRPASKKVVRRDDWGRTHDEFVCDDHDGELSLKSQKASMEKAK